MAKRTREEIIRDLAGLKWWLAIKGSAVARSPGAYSLETMRGMGIVIGANPDEPTVWSTGGGESNYDFMLGFETSDACVAAQNLLLTAPLDEVRHAVERYGNDLHVIKIIRQWDPNGPALDGPMLVINR